MKFHDSAILHFAKDTLTHTHTQITIFSIYQRIRKYAWLKSRLVQKLSFSNPESYFLLKSFFITVIFTVNSDDINMMSCFLFLSSGLFANCSKYPWFWKQKLSITHAVKGLVISNKSKITYLRKGTAILMKMTYRRVLLLPANAVITINIINIYFVSWQGHWFRFTNKIVYRNSDSINSRWKRCTCVWYTILLQVHLIKCFIR